jgi:hypothetical protein
VETLDSLLFLTYAPTVGLIEFTENIIGLGQLSPLNVN